MDTTGIVLGLLTILAIIVGPVTALYVQRKLDEGREAKNRKLWVFKTLMAYRATVLAPQFVQALNLIDVEFNRKNTEETAVRNKWKELLDLFSNWQATPNRGEKSVELIADLLLAMGKCLDYEFDRVYVKKGAYYPEGLGNVEQEQHALRRGVLELLDGKRRIPVAVFEDTFPKLTLRAEDITSELPPEEPRKLRG